jgi:serine phosphatase RsbU (regulator of sigma subunit)
MNGETEGAFDARVALTGSVPGEPPTRLLLVEDDPGDALLVREMLAAGAIESEVVWARSIAEAVRALREGEPPQCVLLDLHLPDAVGLSGLRTVLAEAGDAAVVMMTGLAEEQAGLDAVAAGAQDYLIKGRLAPEWFVRAVRYAVQRKETERAAAALQAGRIRAEENRRLERGLLPEPLLTTTEFQAVPRYRPGRSHSLLGGDFYDVVETDDGSVHAVIGDVSGHGAAEAALGVCLRVAWRSLVLAGRTGPGLVSLLERLLLAERDGHEVFVTLTTLTFPASRDSVLVVRAGHHGMLMRVKDRVELVVPEGGLGLGLMPEYSRWKEVRLDLPHGAGLALFTDGLFEGRTTGDTGRLDLDGLVELARHHATLDAESFVDELVRDAERASAAHGGLDDDVAVLYLGWKAP